MKPEFRDHEFRFSQTVYERLLLAYPQSHRAEYGAAMAQLFRDQCRDAWGESRHWGLLTLWVRILPDLASTARIKVESDAPAADGQSPAYDPYFIQTTFEIIQSELVLKRVVDKLNLNVQWGRKYFNGETLKSWESLKILKDRLQLAPVRNTKLIAITVYGEDRKETADIANAVAVAYEEYRVESHRATVTADLAALQEQFQDQETQIKEKQRELDSLRLKIQKDSASADAAEVQSDVDQKRDLDYLLDFHKTLFEKIEGQKLDLHRPNLSVQITDTATPASAPIRPNKSANIFMGAVAGSLLGLVAGAAIAVICWRSEKRARKGVVPV